jgi:hypothetical protein
MARDRDKPKEPKPISMYEALRKQLGARHQVSIGDWDCDAELVLQAMLQVGAAGNVLFIRPGTGGGSWGLAVWEGDERHPAIWVYAEEQLNEWAEGILRLYKVDRRGNPTESAAD